MSRGVRRNALVKASERHPRNDQACSASMGEFSNRQKSPPVFLTGSKGWRTIKSSVADVPSLWSRPHILLRFVGDNFPSRNLGRLWKQRGHFLAHIIRSPFG